MQKSLSKEDRKMTTYGYARVSTDGQSLASQDAELHAAGCAKVYAEKISGARSDRPELAKVLKRLDTGDVLIVTRLDRLARSTRDLLNILDDIAKRGAGFKSLHDSWADTTSADGRLMVTILAGLAEFERELILARTSDGRARAKARGVKFGRPSAVGQCAAIRSPRRAVRHRPESGRKSTDAKLAAGGGHTVCLRCCSA
jgi:DNA invertase Pin-like site-specific DNA recombinase